MYYPDVEISAIETKKFNGIWFNIDGFECVVISNEERYYTNNNIVVGNMSENFAEVEEYPEITVYTNG